MKISQKLPLLVLLGPTAVGKTALSVELADRFNAEILPLYGHRYGQNSPG